MELQKGRSVARYFFHVRNGIGFVPDEEGAELPDLSAASVRATIGIRSILSEEVMAGRLDLCGAIEIVDADGTLLLVMPYGEAIAIRFPENARAGSATGAAL